MENVTESPKIYDWKKDVIPEYQRQGRIYMTPFAKMLVPNNSDLANDRPDTALSIYLLNATGLCLVGLGCACIPRLYKTIMNRAFAPNWKNFSETSANTLLGCVAVSGYIGAISIAGCRPRIMQWQEEHVAQRLKEVDDDVPGLRTAFGEDEFTKLRHGLTFDQHVTRPFYLGLVGSLVLVYSTLSRKPSITKSERSNIYANFCIPTAGVMTVLGAWMHQPITGGRSARERFREHQLRAREAATPDLEQLRIIEARRAKRLARLREMTFYQKWEWSSRLDEACSINWVGWNVLRERKKKNEEANLSTTTEAEQATQEWKTEGLSEGHPINLI